MPLTSPMMPVPHYVTSLVICIETGKTVYVRDRQTDRERDRDRGEGSTAAADLVFQHLDCEAVYIEPQSDLRFTGAHVAPRVWRVQCTRHQQLLACVCVSV